MIKLKNLPISQNYFSKNEEQSKQEAITVMNEIKTMKITENMMIKPNSHYYWGDCNGSFESTSICSAYPEKPPNLSDKITITQVHRKIGPPPRQTPGETGCLRNSRRAGRSLARARW